MLLVNTESWHFAYYNWLRGLYGYNEPPERTSLCPYFQTILWGSIFCLLFSPLLITGWLMMRCGRWLLKFETFFDPFFAWIDKETPIIKWFNDAPDAFEDGPLVSGLLYTLLGLGCVGAVASLLLGIAGFIGLLGYGAWHILDIFVAAWWAFVHIGWVLFWVFSFIGRIENWVGEGAHWLFTNGELWTSIGEWALIIVATVLAVGAAAVVVGYGSMMVARTKLVTSIWTSIVTKVNGFGAARKERNERVKRERKERQEKMPKWTCSYCDKENKATLDECIYCDSPRKGETAPPSAWMIWIGKCLESCFGRVQRIGKQEIHILGWLTVLIEFIKAVKKGVCPLLEFASPEELQDRTKQQQTQDAEKKAD